MASDSVLLLGDCVGTASVIDPTENNALFEQGNQDTHDCCQANYCGDSKGGPGRTPLRALQFKHFEFHVLAG